MSRVDASDGHKFRLAQPKYLYYEKKDRRELHEIRNDGGIPHYDPQPPSVTGLRADIKILPPARHLINACKKPN
ncbi:unnamed protein product, partial [Iphiclides podalirius]